MKIQLVALRTFPYAGRLIKAGQEFATSYKHGAKVLINLGHADFAPARAADLPPLAEAEPVLNTAVDAAPEVADETCSAPADQQAEPAADIAPQPADEPAAAPPAEAEPEPPVRTRRAYRRRDMTAEG